MSYKILPHLDHVDQLEVVTYRKNQDENEPLDSVTVECTKCGEVVEEVYNANEDNTPPLDCEFPDADRPTWEDGVKDAARIVQKETQRHKAATYPYISEHNVALSTLNEVELHLAVMLSRGSYESHDTVMQTERTESEAFKEARRLLLQLHALENQGLSQSEAARPIREALQDITMTHEEEGKLDTLSVALRSGVDDDTWLVMQEVPDGAHIGDPQPVPCPDCGGTGSNTAKYPIVGCATCDHEADEAVERDACRVSGVMQERKRWQEGLEALEVAAEEADELDGVVRGDGIRHAIEFMRGATVLPHREDRWKQNEVQFARLLCEIVAAYASMELGEMKYLIKELATSMDLNPDQVNKLFDRAEQVWEKAKAEVK